MEKTHACSSDSCYFEVLCVFFPNCTRNHAIAYTNLTIRSQVSIECRSYSVTTVFVTCTFALYLLSFIEVYTLISRIILNLTIYVPTDCIYIIITCKRIETNSLNCTKFHRVPHIYVQCPLTLDQLASSGPRCFLGYGG